MGKVEVGCRWERGGLMRATFCSEMVKWDVVIDSGRSGLQNGEHGRYVECGEP